MGKAMKAMKAMKKKTVNKIAKGRFAKSVVLRGTKEKTAGGLKKSDLFMNKRGRIVSKKQSALAKKRFAQTVGPWMQACKKARAPSRSRASSRSRRARLSTSR